MPWVMSAVALVLRGVGRSVASSREREQDAAEPDRRPDARRPKRKSPDA